MFPYAFHPVQAVISGEDTVSGGLPSNIDMSLSTEKAVAKTVFNELQTAQPGDLRCEFIQSPKNVARYIPAGAICTELSIFGDVVIIDYRLNGIRYLVSYYRDGHVEKIARALDSEDMYTVNSLDMSITCQNRNENSVTLKLPSAQDGLSTLDDNAYDTIDSLDNLTVNDTTWASAIEVDPLSYTEHYSTAPYKARIVRMGSVEIEAFQDTEYDIEQPYRIYETMDYHSEVEKTTITFSVGATLAQIASAFLVPVSTVKLWLTAATVAFNTVNIIQEACKVIDEHAYTYLASKECGIFDVTECNKFVETYQVNDSGKIVMTWSYNSTTGYNNPTWGHSKRSQALMISNEDILAEGLWSYNAQIYQIGFWRWGVGNGFGY